jgi:LysM repeat protein
MAELEKKYSDFQEGECKTEEQVEVVDEKLCPTCEVDPKFKLPGEWFEIEEAYLNKKFCEYHVRVFEVEAKRESPTDEANDGSVIDVAVLRILNDFNKPINSGTKLQVKNSCMVIDTEYNPQNSAATGMAYLVACPAFNFDQILSKDKEGSEQDDDSEFTGGGGQTILKFDGLHGKLLMLKHTIRAYEKFYSLAQHLSDDSFVLRQEDNPIYRISYSSVASRVNNFIIDLSNVLRVAGYPELGSITWFTRKRVDRLKFVFNEGAPFDLEGIYVLPVNGCVDEYEKIFVPFGSPLRQPYYGVVYNFLVNLDRIHNDLTAKETKPWLEWTLDHFYPKYIVDRGNLEDQALNQAGLECLLEDSGLQPGKITDYLAKEIMSAFDSIELEYNKQACRELDRLSEGGKKAKDDEDTVQSAAEERKNKMMARYEKEFIDKSLDYLANEYDTFANLANEKQGRVAFPLLPTFGGQKDKIKYIFKLIEDENVPPAFDTHVILEYDYKNKDTRKREPREFFLDIQTADDLYRYAPSYAEQKFNDMDRDEWYAGFTKDQMSNSPHLVEAGEAWREVWSGESLVLDLFKPDNGNDFEWMDIVRVISLCGISKLAGKALDCLAGGLSFDDFLDIIISKTLEYMEVNTLQLLLEDLPIDVRNKIDEAIEKEFGPSVNLTDLFGIKMAPGGDERLVEFLTQKRGAERVVSLMEKYMIASESQTRKPPIWTDEEVEFMRSQVDPMASDVDLAWSVQDLRNLFDKYYDPKNKIYKNEKVFEYIDDRKNEEVAEGIREVRKKGMAADQFVLKKTKYIIRGRKTKGQVFKDGLSRVGTAINPFDEESKKSRADKREARKLKKSAKKAEESLGAINEKMDELILELQGPEFKAEKERISSEHRTAIANLFSEQENLAALQTAHSVGEPQVQTYTVKPGDTLGQLAQEFLGDSSRYMEIAQANGIADPNLILVGQELLITQDQSSTSTPSSADDVMSTIEQAGLEVDSMLLIQGYEKEVARLAEELSEFSAREKELTDEFEQQSEEKTKAEGIIAKHENTTSKTPAVESPKGPTELSAYEKAHKSFEETALGVKVDIVFDIIFDFLLDEIMEELGLDYLFDLIRSYPAADFGLDKIEAFLAPSCPNHPIVFPPPGDFLKSLSIDVCDPSFGLTLPAINLPSINWRLQLYSQFGEIYREAMYKLMANLIENLAKRLLATLEGAFCNALETAGGLVADMVANGSTADFENRFYDALNEAFCNNGDNPETAQKKAEELADALFNLSLFDGGSNPQGSGKKVAETIGSVATTNEVLAAIVARPGESDPNVCRMIAGAISAVAPEMRALLGDPSQVAYFFQNLGSYLPSEDRERIRNILDADVPNLPASSAICLTNEEFEEWNGLRNTLLQDQGFSPEDAADRIGDLNRKARLAAEAIADDIAGLDSGNLMNGAIIDELSKDLCNLENVINANSTDSLSRSEQTKATKRFYKNLESHLMDGFCNKNGVIGEAMRDFRGSGEFIRMFKKFFNPNYGNSQYERERKYDDSTFLGQFLMDALTEEDRVIGQYPETVAISQREQITSPFGKAYSFSKGADNIKFVFADEQKMGFITSTFQQSVIAKNVIDDSGTFDYQIELKEKIDDQEAFKEFSSLVPIIMSDDKIKYMEDIGFQYGDRDDEDMRKAAFNEFANRLIPLPDRNYSGLYEDSFESFNKLAVELMLTDNRRDDGIPVGYKFGYINDDMDSDSTKYYNPDGVTPYNLDESEKKLGKFGHPRVIALDPKLYGGRYSNPNYHVESRQFVGWMELATKSFTSPSGCEPKTPPLISFNDINDKTNNLSRVIKEDPRLSKDPECVGDKPFHVLLDRNTKAHLDGIVRTTIRSYLLEYFMKGYGLFSNVEMTEDNFDQGMFSYITQRMKDEMYDLGTFFHSNMITIVREKYWYTFLEQCVETYQRSIDHDGVIPPDEIYDALNYIQYGLDRYVSVNQDIKDEMSKKLSRMKYIKKPPANYDPLSVVRQGAADLTLQAIAFRLTTDPEDKDNFFDGGKYDDYSSFDLFFASIKKLRFFQKIYFVALYEKQATLVLNELIRQEFRRLYDTMADGLNDKPNHKDLSKSIFSAFPGSSSRVGLNDYYVEKNTQGSADPGSVPEVMSDNSSSPIPVTTEPQFIIESYGRLVDRRDPNLPPQILNRDQRYVGAISLANMSEFFNQNSNMFEENYLSDFFGNLMFTYKGSIRGLFEKGFVEDQFMTRLYILNGVDMTLETQPMESIALKIQRARQEFLAGRDIEDFSVIYDSAFLLEGETLEPSGTFGSTGVKYGLRLSIVFPEGYLSTSEINLLRANPNFISASRNEKTFLFDDGSFVLPIVSEEIDLVDELFSRVNPFSGTERFDLECLVNKMTERTDFKFFIENIFNLKQCSSLLAIYCMETFMSSLGRKVVPEDADDPNDSVNYERAFGDETEIDEGWNGAINKKGKNSLRKHFKSLYLARTPDGLNTDDDDDQSSLGLAGLFASGNPFDFFSYPSFKIPWWKKRKLKTKIYDANGQECADPKKDLT